MSRLPDRPDLEYLRKQAKKRGRVLGIALHEAQRALAREYGFPSWPRLVRHVQAVGLDGVERALALADLPALETALAHDPTTANLQIDGLPPLLYLLRRSIGGGSDIRDCARVLLEAGADPNARTEEHEDWGTWEFFAIRSAVDRDDVALIRLLIDHGAEPDDDAIYHACERSSNAILDALWKPGAQDMVNHKLDFEDIEGLRWFLDRGADVNARCLLHHAIARGRGLAIIGLLLDAGADPNKPWDFWDVGRRAARARGAVRSPRRLRAPRITWCDRESRPGRRGRARCRAR